MIQCFIVNIHISLIIPFYVNQKMQNRIEKYKKITFSTKKNVPFFQKRWFYKRFTRFATFLLEIFEFSKSLNTVFILFAYGEWRCTEKNFVPELLDLFLIEKSLIIHINLPYRRKEIGKNSFSSRSVRGWIYLKSDAFPFI